MPDPQRLLDLIEEGIVAHGGDLGGWTRREGDTLQLFDGRVTLTATVEGDDSGDRSGIERTIELPSERLDRVLERLHTVQRELAHRVRIVERTPTSLTVRARTESLQAVTRLDLELADRVDDAVADVGSSG